MRDRFPCAGDETEVYQLAKSRIETFRATAAAIGAWHATLYALSRVVSRLTGGRARIVMYEFVAQPVQAAPRAGRPGKFRIDWAGSDSPLFAQVERPPAVIAARFRRHARCLAATVGDATLAGFLWFVVGPYDEDEVRARFHPAPEGRTAWDFDVTILPDYRMGRLFLQLWDRAAMELSALGVSHTLSRISAFNAASLASHRRLGATRRGRALFLCAGRLQLMISSIPPKWHLSWREDQRPDLVIRA